MLFWRLVSRGLVSLRALGDEAGCDSLCLGGWKTAAGRGPEPGPGGIFSPVGVLAPSQIKAQVSHCAQGGQKLGEVSSRQGETVALEPWPS